MNYWKLFKSAGLFIQFFKSVANLVRYMSTNKKFSEGLMSIVVLDFEKILESGAIDIPGVDERDLAIVIEDIRKNLVK